MLLKGISTLAVVLVSVGIGTSTANANPFRHIDEVALAMRSDAARAINEIRYHYRGSAEYEHLYNDAFEMYQLAGHIHELTHTANGIDHIRADVAQLDELVHHMEELVLLVNSQPVPYGHSHGVSYGYGYGHGVPVVGRGYRTNRLSQILASLADHVHHMEADLGGAPAPVITPAPAPAVVPGPVILPGPSAGPVYRSPGGTRVEFSKGKNRFAITLGR